MNPNQQSELDLERLVREARLERSMAIGNAIADGIAAVVRGIQALIAKLASVHSGRPAQQPRG